MKYKVQSTNSGFVIVQTSNPEPGMEGMASLFKMTSYLRDGHGRIRRFATVELAQAAIDKLQTAVL